MEVRPVPKETPLFQTRPFYFFSLQLEVFVVGNETFFDVFFVLFSLDETRPTVLGQRKHATEKQKHIVIGPRDEMSAFCSFFARGSSL